MPMSCIPENAAFPLMINISKQNGVPFLSLTFDEHSAKEEVYTRLETFIDILNENRKNMQISS
jgi:benzoyl-CoA reductase/2-hydroxyglutaryl-CoA dehydratase subunit BcrC/BadD/HgdB